MENYLKLISPDEKKLGGLESYEVKNSRLFIIFIHITCIPLFLFTIANYASGKPLAGHVDLISFVGFVSTLAAYKYTGAYRACVIAFTLNCQFVIGGQHFIAPLGLWSNLLWFPLIIISSSYLLGKKLGFRLGLFNTACILAAEVLPHFMRTPTENFLKPEILQYNVSIIIVTTLSSFLITSRILFEEKNFIGTLERQKNDLFEEKETTAALMNIIAHDIANPLTTLQARLQQLDRTLEKQGELDPEKTKSHLKKLNERANEIAQNIEMIRKYRALESGKLEIKLSEVNLKKVIDSSIDTFSDKITAKNLTINKTYSNEEDFLVKADNTSLQISVVNNLLSNAIKFSHESNQIDFKIEKVGDAIEFRIRDYGVGIPVEIRPFLFSSDRPTSRKGTKGESGTGFGMPIMKMFVEKYDAEVVVEHPESGGTCFLIRFISSDNSQLDSQAA